MIKIGEHYVETEVENIIDELKRQLELNGVKRFYKTRNTPNNLMVCCPFHKEGQERKPSMGIYKKDGTCHCFTCDWAGSLSEMVSNCFGYYDLGRYGEKWILKNFMSVEVEERKDVELDFGRANHRSIDRSRGTSINDVRVGEASKSNIISNDSNIRYVSEAELDRYRYYHPYWAERKITSERVIELFDLGFDKETNCITFPVRDINGNCLFIARRNVRTKFFNYPEGVVKPLYGLYELSKQLSIPKELIICESMIDALTCWEYGDYAVALNGLGNNLQFEQLRKLPCRSLIIGTDNDEAGMRARERIKKNVPNKILKQFVFPGDKKDINELSYEEFLSLLAVFL